MRMFNKVVIIGTGLIGGSLGLDLKKKNLAGRITGLSRRKHNADFARKAGALDRVATSLSVVSDADLVILAAPIEAIINIGLKVSKLVKKDCIVIDVGSSKENIVAKLGGLIPNFIGCHPLAGSEKRGAENLQSGIFSGSFCIITPEAKTNKAALKKIKLLWSKLGSRVVILTPKRHDQILAYTSHLAHAVAFSLMGTVSDKFLNFCSGGLKDTTRIASSDAGIWSQIFLSNRGNLLNALLAFQKKLGILKLALKNRNKKLLTRILEHAKEKRDKLG